MRVSLRRLLGWAALLSLSSVALLLLNGAAFSAWMSGGPPNPYPQGWALRSQALFCWSLSAALAAAFGFLSIRRYPDIGVRVWLTLAAGVVLAVTPLVAREIIIDKCLDSGGRWSAASLQCER